MSIAPEGSMLRDAVCIVTGGGSGIGRALCLRLAAEGATVIAAGRTASKVAAVAKEVQAAGGNGRARALDVADADGLRVFVDEVLSEFGRIDVLVNNAGQNSPRRRLLTTTPDEIRALFDANVLGAMFCTRAVLPSMRAAGKGTIVNVSSTAALEPGVLTGAAYSAAKAALENFTHYLAQETRNTGIRTCVVFPGEVDTPILEHRAHPPDAAARATMLRSEDVAEAIALVLRLPARAAITELVIKPTHLRSVDAELQKE